MADVQGYNIYMWPLALIGVIGLVLYASRGNTKIFITYDYDNDRHYKNMLVAWAQNSSFDLSFHDKSVDISVDSDELAVIRRVVSSQIKQSSRVLCLVGKDTWRSDWVDWEINKAIEHGIPLVAVKTAKKHKSPEALKGAGAKWALAFKFHAIKKAIEQAA